MGRNAPECPQWLIPPDGIEVVFVFFSILFARELFEVFICLSLTVLRKFKKNEIRKTFSKEIKQEENSRGLNAIE